jgi:Glycosyl transferase family 2
MATYSIRWYKSFCQKVSVLDLGSEDGTQEYAKSQGCEVRQFDCKKEFDDRLNRELKDREWMSSDADWIVIGDCDELICFPAGVDASFSCYEQQNFAVIKPYGYEMHSDVFPTTDGQIFDNIKHASREDVFYAKPMCFSRKLVTKTEFSMGAHALKATLNDGKILNVDQRFPFAIPPAQMCHCHHIYPIDEITARYQGVRDRMSAINKQMKWGLQEDARVHAMKKRASIVSKLERIIP